MNRPSPKRAPCAHRRRRHARAGQPARCSRRHHRLEPQVQRADRRGPARHARPRSASWRSCRPPTPRRSRAAGSRRRDRISSAATAVDAAIAAAHRATLAPPVPAQQAGIEAAYQAALARLADGPARHGGPRRRRAGSGLRLLARASTTAPPTPEALPIRTRTPASTCRRRLPARAAVAAAQALADDQRGPVPAAAPPALASSAWAAEFNEVPARWAARSGSRRSAEQTEIARFWEYSLPAIYHGVVQSVALAPGSRRELQTPACTRRWRRRWTTRLISVFDAKSTTSSGVLVTAIRNGDIDGNDATVVEPGWRR